jgi:hypothetical protein
VPCGEGASVRFQLDCISDSGGRLEGTLAWEGREPARSPARWNCCGCSKITLPAEGLGMTKQRRRAARTDDTGLARS